LLPEGAPAIQEYSSHPPLLHSLALGESFHHLGEKNIRVIFGRLPSLARLIKPLDAHPLTITSQAPDTSAFSALVATPPSNFTCIDSVPGFFDSIHVKTTYAARVSAYQAIAHLIGIFEGSGNKVGGVSKRK